MSGIPQTKLLAKLSRRRTTMAFLTVAAATFFCLSLLWPLSTSSWRSESEVSLTLTERKESASEFRGLLDQVVKRHTSIQSITDSLNANGMGVEGKNVSTVQLAEKIRERLKVVLIDKSVDPDHLRVRVGLDGAATEKENYFVNVLATTIAKDFMTSPLAGILPTQQVPRDDIESLRQRHMEIEQRANELLAQIQNNLRDSANLMANAETPGKLMSNRSRSEIESQLEDLRNQRQRIAASSGNSSLELAAVDQLTAEVKSELDTLEDSHDSSGPFLMASHTLNREVVGSSLEASLNSLHTTIGDLANVAAEACIAAESVSVPQAAFTIESVIGRPPAPVGGIPNRKELFGLLLAASFFATIVTFAFQPFANRGFESVEHIGKKLKLPVIATLEARNEFEDVTGPGIMIESAKPETPGSNQVVNICKWILFCSLMLTIGFCLVNSGVREAFFVSPFHGFAEIVWTLKGN